MGKIATNATHMHFIIHLHNDLFPGKSFEKGTRAETLVLMDRCPVKISANAKTNGLLYMQHIERMERDWCSLSLRSLSLHAAHRFLRKYAALIFTIHAFLKYNLSLKRYCNENESVCHSGHRHTIVCRPVEVIADFFLF